MEARPYATAITELVRSVALRMENPEHPLLARRPEKRALLVIVTGDRGLAGAFSSNSIRRGVEFLKTHTAEKVEVLPIGRKGRDAFRRLQKWPIVSEHVGITSRAEFAKAREIAAGVIAQYAEEKTDAVYLLFQEFKSVITQKMVFEKVAADRSGGTGRERLEGGLHLRAAGRTDFGRADAAIRGSANLPHAGGFVRRGTRGTHDRDGRGDEQRLRLDRITDFANEQNPPGRHHERNY